MSAHIITAIRAATPSCGFGLIGMPENDFKKDGVDESQEMLGADTSYA